MHAYKFGLIAVLSCIAMIGAIPVGNHMPIEVIVRRQDGLGADLKYVSSVFAVTVCGRSNLVKSFTSYELGKITSSLSPLLQPLVPSLTSIIEKYVPYAFFLDLI